VNSSKWAGSSGGTSSGSAAGVKGKQTKQEEEESEGLAVLIPDIQETARAVQAAVQQQRAERSAAAGPGGEDEDEERPGSSAATPRADRTNTEHVYMDVMRELQFGESILASGYNRQTMHTLCLLLQYS